MAAEAPKPECGELLLSRCEKCHYLERVCSQVGEKSKRRWKATLKRMVQRRGAELSGDEQEILLECLTAPNPVIVKECSKLNSSQP
ncbi:MAG: hypothetical protein K9K37_04465 [Desulfocapsa sp.]|nr:hypothetical protein [Desulfocapsa sp.]